MTEKEKRVFEITVRKIADGTSEMFAVLAENGSTAKLQALRYAGLDAETGAAFISVSCAKEERDFFQPAPVNARLRLGWSVFVGMKGKLESTRYLVAIEDPDKALEAIRKFAPRDTNLEIDGPVSPSQLEKYQIKEGDVREVIRRKIE